MQTPAKINLFLKITALRSDNFCEIASRFVRIDELYDEIFLIPLELARELDGMGFSGALKQCKWFLNEQILDEASPMMRLRDFAMRFEKFDALPNEQNANILCKKVTLKNGILSNFFTKSNIFSKVLKIAGINDLNGQVIALFKNIPTFAGLGGASSNAAGLLKLLAENNYQIDIQNLAPKIGADVAFFASGAKCANVRGFGDIIEEFSDTAPQIDLHFACPCETAKVFSEFKRAPNFCPDASELLSMKNEQILELNNYALNDLLAPVLRIYTPARVFAQKGYFLSGSGGSFFTNAKKGNK